jgi:membrane protease YdiL (CAAX protease family)
VIGHAALGVAVGLAMAGAVRLAVVRFAWARALRNEAYGLRIPLVLALAAAVGEEIVFRGLLLPADGLIVSSAAFALCHVGPRSRHLAWGAFAFLCGLALGGIMLLTGDLAAAVAAHLAANLAVSFGAARARVNGHGSERRTGRDGNGHRGAPGVAGVAQGRDSGACARR